MASRKKGDMEIKNIYNEGKNDELNTMQTRIDQPADDEILLKCLRKLPSSGKKCLVFLKALSLLRNIPASPAYGVYISQLIRYSRACSNYEDFIARGQLLTTRLQYQGYTTPWLKSTFRKFFGRQHDIVGVYEKSASEMPRGSIPMRVRRRHSDAKWRASVAACYDTLKHVIPNNEKMPKRKISKALILQETERHIVNIESKLKELLSQKAKSKGKSILYKNDDGFVEACLEDVKSDFSRQQHALYLRNEYRSQRKRSFPSDIEQGLIEMRSSCCELNVIPSDHIDQYITIDLTQKNSMNSQNNTTDETSQTSKQSQGHCSEEEDEVSVQLSENSLMYPANTRNALDKTYSTEMTPRMEALLKTPDKSLRPKRPYNRRNRFVANQVKTAGLKHHQELSHVPANKNSIQRFKARLYKDMVDRPKRHSPEKSFKQLLFDTNSGFTPLKLPENHLISPALPHPSVSEILENSPLTALTSELKNQCDGLPDNNGVTQSTEDFDDPSNLFCTESIDQMDLDDSFDRDEQTTPNCRTSKKRQIKREIDRQHSRKFRTRIRSYNDYEHEESQSDSGPVYTIKREARKCRRQLEKSFPAVEIKSKEDVPVITGVFENTDNSCRDFDGYFLFYQQMAEEKHSDNVTEIASEVSQMWQNLSTDTRDTFVAMAAHETSHSSSSDLSEDLIELDVKPLKDGSCFRTSTPTPLQPSCSQVVPISENTDFKHLGFKMGTQVQANIDLQMVPTQPLCDFNGATSILLVKPDIIQLDENYIADEVILTSQDYEVPSLPDEVPEEKALDLSMERHSSTENRFTNDHDLQSVSWNTQVVPKMDFAAFLQHDLF